MRIVWCDTETTGKNIDKCSVGEVACIITDENFNELEVFNRTANVCSAYWEEDALRMHISSGLFDRMSDSPPWEVVRDDLQTFLYKHFDLNEKKPLVLAGSSVWFDRMFLQKEIANFEHLFSHQQIDTTSLKIIISCCHGEEVAGGYINEGGKLKITEHRALPDIRFSIAQMKYFIDNGLLGTINR